MSTTAILEKLKDGEVARSPGMKYKHYAPKADVTILKGSFACLPAIILQPHAGHGVWALCFDGEEAHSCPFRPSRTAKTRTASREAHHLFTALRDLDRHGRTGPSTPAAPLSDGVSMAVYNRLIRAAAFRVVEVMLCRIVGITGRSGCGKSTLTDSIPCAQGYPLCGCRPGGAGSSAAGFALHSAAASSEFGAGYCR